MDSNCITANAGLMVGGGELILKVRLIIISIIFSFILCLLFSYALIISIYLELKENKKKYRKLIWNWLNFNNKITSRCKRSKSLKKWKWINIKIQWQCFLFVSSLKFSDVLSSIPATTIHLDVFFFYYL